MKTNDTIAITWRDVDANGYTDVFAASAFTEMKTGHIIKHDVFGPKGGEHSAKCRCTVRSMAVELDYQPFAKFNADRGMVLGVMRIRFSDDDRTAVQRVEWKSQGSSTFENAAFEATTYVLAPITDYKGPQKRARRVFRKIRERPGQAAFRQTLKRAYGNVCCISGCAIPEALDGAHIDAYLGPGWDHPQNGFLLRRDLHALFDANLIGIEPKTRVIYFAEEAREWPEYARIHGKQRLKLPRWGGKSYLPSLGALERRWKRFDELHSRDGQRLLPRQR